MDAGSLMMEVESVSECSTVNQEVWDEQEEERAMTEYVMAARERREDVEQTRFISSPATALLAEHSGTKEVKVEVEDGEDMESGEESSDDTDEINDEEEEEEREEKEDQPTVEGVNRPRRKRHTPVSNKVYVCDICNNEYGNSESFRVHKKTHSDDTSGWFVCDVDDCGRKYKSRYSLQTHQKRYHENIKPHACPNCSKCFPELGILKRHMMIHTGEKPHECKHCGEAFRFTSSLAQHKNHAHSDAQNPYTCEMCNLYFKDLNDYKEHTKLHWSSEPGQFCCHVCGRGFRRKSFVREHVFSLHMNQSERGSVQCEICKLQFPSHKRMMLHKRVHVESAMRCPKCGLFFKSKLAMERHSRENCQDAKFRCQNCPRVFRYEVPYNSHMKKHSEQALICPICGSRFASVALLAKHKRKAKRCATIQIPGSTGVHNTEFETKLAENTANGRAYTCLVCFKGFKYKTSYIKHQEKHVGEGAFSCPVCYQNFSYDSALNQHMKAHPEYQLPHWRDGRPAAATVQSGLISKSTSNVLLDQETVVLDPAEHENEDTSSSSNSLHHSVLAEDRSDLRGQRSRWHVSEELRSSMTVAEMKEDDHQFTYSLTTVKVEMESE